MRVRSPKPVARTNGVRSCATLVAVTENMDASPPIAKRIPKQLTCHGDVRIDNYYRLRERDNPEVLAYLEAENRYTEYMMQPLHDLQQRLYDEMLGRIREDDSSVPFPLGSFLYYKRTETGKAYPIHCRRRPEGPEQIVLDENELASGHEFFALGNFEVSPNGQLLAYSIDTEGDEAYVTRIKNLSSGRTLPEHISNTYYSLVWANDDRHLFYVTLDAAKRPYRVWRHCLGNAKDDLIFEETDERFEVELYKSRDRRYLFLQTESKVTSEVRFLDADTPQAHFQVVWPRRQNILYDIESHGDDFYVQTNEEAEEFRILLVSAQSPQRENAKEFLAMRNGVTIEGVDAFYNHLVVHERHAGLPAIRIQNLSTEDVHYIRFTEPAYTLGGAPNEVFHTETLRFTYTSLVTPASVFDYNMQTRSQELRKQTEVLGYHAPDYTTERIWATAEDGTAVPISLVYKKGLVRDGRAPLLLYGYGAYGLRSEPEFHSERVSLLNRGFVYAIAHIRGGGDLGRAWYNHGKLLQKKNTFLDFIACAEHLIAERYTSKDKLAIQGGSAGGMLVGAVVNMRPDLFHTVSVRVPFVDTLTTCLDPTLPLTVGEYEEWGNPEDEAYYWYIKSYSPYDNVKPGSYPHMLITAGLSDPRVSYWEPAKWTAKLRAARTDRNLHLLKTNMEAGHFGASGRYGRFKDTAFSYAFIVKSLETPLDS
jgi:oligopeptidase B